jgi:hypothetical protein
MLQSFCSQAVTLCAAVLASAALAAEPEPQAEHTLSTRDLAGWKVLDQLTFEKHGKVAANDGEITLSAGKPATGIAWKGKLPVDNYELSLQARRLEGDDFFCGLTFPVGKEHVTLILGGWGGSVTGLSNVDDAAAVENETTGHVPFKQGQWYAVRVRVTPEEIEAWVDREQIVDLARQDRTLSVWWEQEPARPLGITTWNTSAAVKEVKIASLKAK